MRNSFIVLALIAMFVGTIPPFADASMDYLAWQQLSTRGTRALAQQRYDHAEVCFWASIQSLSPYPSSATKDYELYHSYSQLATIYKVRNNPVDELRCQFAANWHQFWGYMVAVAPLQIAEALPVFFVGIVALELLFAMVFGLRQANAAGTGSVR